MSASVRRLTFRLFVYKYGPSYILSSPEKPRFLGIYIKFVHSVAHFEFAFSFTLHLDSPECASIFII